MDIEALLTSEVYRFIMVFCRVGTAMMMMPGFGDVVLPPQVRLFASLALSFAIHHAIPEIPTVPPQELSVLVLAIIQEITAGFFMGISARIIMSCLNMAGTQIAMSSALGNAFMTGMDTYGQSTIIATALTVFGTTLIFATNMHHLLITAVINSYVLFPFADLPSLFDFSDQIIKGVSMAFQIGFLMSAPFIFIALIANTAMGIANKIMPQLPVFFVVVPVLIFMGILFLGMSLYGIADTFSDFMSSWAISMRF